MYSTFLDLITPTNLLAEREKFFANSSYHPVFHYTWEQSPPDLTSVPASKLPLYKAILTQDHPSITRSAKAEFATEFEPALLSSARALLVSPRAPLHSGSAQEYASLLQDAFNFFKIDYQTRVVPHSGFNARPSHKSRTIFISQDIHYELFSMAGGVRHELVHVLRHLNGQHNGINRSPRYLPTEEGLASYFQDHVPGVTDNGLLQHALEYLGSSVGISGSLRDIYAVMRDGGMSAELAWKRASRHKFGFINTQEPGDIIKPAMYYYNELKVAQLSTEEKIRLFTGKISVEDLPKYPKYFGYWDEKLVTQYFIS